MGKISSAEKSKRYRERHREEVKRKNRLRMMKKRQEERKVRESDAVAREKYREKERTRKMLYRKKKKEETPKRNEEPGPSTSRGSYRTPQSFGKAVKKAVTSLPTSPSKRKAVVKRLALDVGISLSSDTSRRRRDSQMEETKRKVLEFFFRPDIVFTAPGIKDEIVVWNNGVKSKERKFYLTLSLKEAHNIFCDQNPENLIGFSTFCKLRPPNVLLLHNTPADQCKCKICENFFLKLDALKIKYNSESFWKNSLCETTSNSMCWWGTCPNCCSGQKLWTSLEFGEVVMFKEWEKPSDSRLQCSVKEASVDELIGRLREDFKEVVKHINVKRVQHTNYLEDKENPEKRVLHFDFAMNYSCEYQSEVQSALWSRNSVTLFTAVSYWKGKTNSYLICSDTLNKDKRTVSYFIKKLYEIMEPKPQDTDVEEVMWSDGPSSEFKNRYMFSFLNNLCESFQKRFTWKYFATSHGKGAVDGIGGSAKSLVRAQVMSRSATAPVVKSAEDFYHVVQKVMPKTKVILVKDEDIPKNQTWKNSPAIPGTRSIHIVSAQPGKELTFFENAEEEKQNS